MDGGERFQGPTSNKEIWEDLMRSIGISEHKDEDIFIFQGGPKAQTDSQTLGWFTVHVYCVALWLLCSYMLFLSICCHPLPLGFWLDGSLA